MSFSPGFSADLLFDELKGYSSLCKKSGVPALN